MDEWPVLSARFNRGRGPVIVERQPRTSLERRSLAQKFASDFGLSFEAGVGANNHGNNVRLLVDDCERHDPFEQAYAPWPVRLYLIRDGILEWLSRPKNCSHEDSVRELIAKLNLSP